MKVKDLIIELQKLNPEQMVVVAGYEGGYNEISALREVPLKLNVHEEWYYGKHEQAFTGTHVDALAIQIS